MFQANHPLFLAAFLPLQKKIPPVVDHDYFEILPHYYIKMQKIKMTFILIGSTETNTAQPISN